MAAVLQSRLLVLEMREVEQLFNTTLNIPSRRSLEIAKDMNRSCETKTQTTWGKSWGFYATELTTKNHDLIISISSHNIFYGEMGRVLISIPALM
jgi:hypothetical protein